MKSLRSTLEGSRRWLSAWSLALVMALGSVASHGQDEEETVETLYQKAAGFIGEERYEEASKAFERIFEISKGVERLFENYGAQAGGLLFDYGLTLLPQQRWEEARKAFEDCVNAAKTAVDIQTPIKSTNTRENLAKFQLGYCEAQLGRHEEALRLYDEYLAGKPSPEEVAQVRASFKLRYGTSLARTGRVDEGTAAIQELFDNRKAWNATPQFLMQGLLELGLVYVEQTNAAAGDSAAIDQIEDKADEFLDRNGQLVHLDPLAQYRFGYYDRLRKLGLESTKAGLYSLALRYFSYLPTIEDIRNDLSLTLARQPTGTKMPAHFQTILDELAEREKAPVHPDAEILRLIAVCYERLGNYHAPRAIYWYLADQYPEVDKALRGEILHEASRLSSMVADYPAAQYFGEKFESESPGESALRNNVATFMLQSLFTSRAYDQVISTAERVRGEFPAGAPDRELADALYPMALYSLQKHADAEEPFSEYVKTQPEGSNREMVLYHRASNSLVLGKMREAAEQFEDFLKAYPESERFLDGALADLAVARYNLGDYPAAVEAVDKLVEARPASAQVPRSQVLKGDALLAQSGPLAKEHPEDAAAMRGAALGSYVAAVASGQVVQAGDAARADYHRETVAQALWKSAEIYYQDGDTEKGLAQYDVFLPDYAGTAPEPQISVFSLEPLEKAGRGEEGLAQAEKVILELGSKPAQEQDITLLREAIGSYSESSVRVRGLEKTLDALEKFPGLDPRNQALLTWLKIQQVILLQGEQKKLDKESTEHKASAARIAQIFEELRLFEKRELTEFALQHIGLYFADSDNPFLGVPYFEELLARTSPEAEPYKVAAEMEIGKIEMRSPEPAKVQSARERFRRIVASTQAEAVEFKGQAQMNLADIHMKAKEWKDALAALDAINKDKSMFGKERAKRAEAAFKLGVVLDALGDPAGANQAYLSVVSTYAAYHDWVTQAWERYVPNSLADIERMETKDSLSIALKRQRQLSLYKLCAKYIYQWQKLDERVDAPSGALARLRRDLPAMKERLKLTPEEETAILNELGIGPKK